MQDDPAAAALSRKEEQERFLIVNQRFTHKKSPFICHFKLNIKHLLVRNSLLLSGTHVETICGGVFLFFFLKKGTLSINLWCFSYFLTLYDDSLADSMMTNAARPLLG